MDASSAHPLHASVWSGAKRSNYERGKGRNRAQARLRVRQKPRPNTDADTRRFEKGQQRDVCSSHQHIHTYGRSTSRPLRRIPNDLGFVLWCRREREAIDSNYRFRKYACDFFMWNRFDTQINSVVGMWIWIRIVSFPLNAKQTTQPHLRIIIG